MKATICRMAMSLTIAALSLGATQETPLPGDSVYQLNARLKDSTGQAVDWQSLRGKPRIATMFYTSCPFICPLTVDSLRSIERSLPPGERSRLSFVLISMDPERDTPARLAAVKSERHLDPHAWLLLRPEPQDLRSIAGMLGVRYRALANGEFNHTTTLVLLDADGRVLARTERVGSNGDPEFLSAVRAAAKAAKQ